MEVEALVHSGSQSEMQGDRSCVADQQVNATMGPEDALEAKWRKERERLDQKYREKIIDARRKTRSLGMRRDEALKLLDGLRDLVRGDNLDMDDSSIDSAILALVRDGVTSGRLTKMIDQVRGTCAS